MLVADKPQKPQLCIAHPKHSNRFTDAQQHTHPTAAHTCCWFIPDNIRRGRTGQASPHIWQLDTATRVALLAISTSYSHVLHMKRAGLIFTVPPLLYVCSTGHTINMCGDTNRDVQQGRTQISSNIRASHTLGVHLFIIGLGRGAASIHPAGLLPSESTGITATA
jgi:hypothetical protein